MATTTGLMTVEQFRQQPETGPSYYELHQGELVRVTRPKMKHARVQRRLRELLSPLLRDGIVETELAFRPLPEYELRVADVAYVSRERWRGADDDDNLRGAPEIVIEVLSPSNTVSEINEKSRLCLEHGSLEFWVVDPQLREIRISTPDGITRTYKSGESLPLALAAGQTLAVDSVFAVES